MFHMLFLLLSLILQVVQIHGQDEVYGCRLVGRDSDFGQDYYDWISVRSLRACQNKCLDLNEPCSGFTYVHNNRKNCALYDVGGVEEGVKRRNQDSYLCECVANCSPPCPTCYASGGRMPRFLSAGSGISDLSSGGGIGGSYSSSCGRHFCKARGKCCLKAYRGQSCSKVRSC